MGQRAVESPAVVAAPRRFSLPGGQVVLAVGLLALLAIGLLPRALDRDESAALLIAGSLAGERDRVTGGEDRERAAELRTAGHDAPLPLHGEPIAGSLLQGLFLAPWAALGGGPLAFVAQWSLLALGALLAGRALARRAGRLAGWLPPLLLFGSAAFAQALRLWPEPFLFALVLLAFALAEGPAPPPPMEEIPDLYPEERRQPSARVRLRWFGVGLLLGSVVAAAPWTVPLLWPAALRVPAEHRQRGRLALLGGAALALLLGIVLAAGTGGASFGVDSLRAAVAAPFAAVVDDFAPAASGWSLVYALAGRHLGVLFYFAPWLLLAVLGGGRTRAAASWGAALLSLALLAALRPFDLGGGAAILGLRAFLPVWGALWLVAERPPRVAEQVAAWALAAAVLWPLWRSPLTPWDAEGVPRYDAPYLAPWAPLETTRAGLVPGAELDFEGGRLFVLPGEALGGGSVARVPAGPWVELLVGVPGELTGVWVEAGEQSGNELPVRGGEVTDTMFRPDGGIAFLVRPSRRYARHAVAGDSAVWSFYHLRLRFPAPPGREFTVRLRPG
jgi:hypothetical protein